MQYIIHVLVNNSFYAIASLTLLSTCVHVYRGYYMSYHVLLNLIIKRVGGKR